MKTTFLALILTLVAAQTRGSEPIEGAFGFKLGQEYRPTTPLVARVANGFSDVYKVEPAAPNPTFDAFYVKLTPRTHLIYEIIGVGKLLHGEEGVQTERGIKAYLQAKYTDNPNPFPYDQITQEKAVVSFYMSRSGSDTTTTVAYRCLPLYTQASDEERALKAEQDAAQARQALKSFDSTGL